MDPVLDRSLFQLDSDMLDFGFGKSTNSTPIVSMDDPDLNLTVPPRDVSDDEDQAVSNKGTKTQESATTVDLAKKNVFSFTGVPCVSRAVVLAKTTCTQDVVDRLVYEALQIATVAGVLVEDVIKDDSIGSGRPAILCYPQVFSAYTHASPIVQWMSERSELVGITFDDLVMGRLLLSCHAARRNVGQGLEDEDDDEHATHTDDNDIFSTQAPRTLARTERILRISKGIPPGKLKRLDTAFWDACFERMHCPGDFVKRRTYLRLEIAIEIKARQTMSKKSLQDVMETVCDGIVEMMEHDDDMPLIRAGYDVDMLMSVIKGANKMTDSRIREEGEQLAKSLMAALRIADDGASPTTTQVVQCTKEPQDGDTDELGRVYDALTGDWLVRDES